jgi:hypothetical protein
MLDLFTHPDLRLFTTLAGFVFALLMLEIVLMLIGGSSQLGEVDLDADFAPDFDVDASALEALDGMDLSDVEPITDTTDLATGQGWMHALGLDSVPSALWLAGLLSFLSMGGFLVQGLVQTLGLGFLPSWLVLAGVAAPALWMTKRYARFLGRLIPSVETTAISKISFHKRQGTVVGGLAARNRPAEVVWVDGHGNSHYLLAEPLSDDETIPQGADVLILRTRDKQARLISLS